MSNDCQQPLIVIVGPTASGKTSLAVDMAKKYDGEVICADSRTIYKGMDIGTAKPTQKEQAGVLHWGLDIVEPGARFTAADFKDYANTKIADIRSRGKVPFLVGGTGLYVDAVVFDYQFGGEVDDAWRQQLEAMTIDELRHYCISHNIELPENYYNKRYLIRAIERGSVDLKRRSNPVENSFIVGIATDREVLRSRIVKRAEQLFEDGVVDEAIMLGKKYGWDSEAMTGNIYPLVRQYQVGQLSLQEVQEKFTTADWRLAKRQLTWLRRSPYINWQSLDSACDTLDDYLANWRAK